MGKVKDMSCNKDCFNCTYKDCEWDESKLKDRSQYHHDRYIKKKLGTWNNTCRFCGKVVKGEMIRIHSKNYCSIDCVLCHLYEINERNMRIVKV